HLSSGERKTNAGRPSRYSTTTDGTIVRSGSGTASASASATSSSALSAVSAHSAARAMRHTHRSRNGLVIGDQIVLPVHGPPTTAVPPRARAHSAGSYMASSSTGGSVNVPEVTARTV